MTWQLEIQCGPSASSLSIAPDAGILDHALAEGLKLSHGCKRGDCGECAATLITGEVMPLNAGQPWKRAQEIYLCNTRACSNLVLRLPYLPEAEHLKVLRSPAKIQALTMLSADVAEVCLRLPPSVVFDFLPGQYIRLTNKCGTTRSYSLANPPNPDRRLTIHVRRVAGGVFSDYLFTAAASGDLLQLEGPFGRFFLRDQAIVTKTICLATGTGIAPIHALLAGLSPDQHARCGETHVYWGNRQPQDAYFLRELAALGASLNAAIHPIFSQEAGSDNRLRYVQSQMAVDHPDLRDAQIFASGSLQMVEAARAQSLSLGLAPDRFYSDPFTAS